MFSLRKLWIMLLTTMEALRSLIHKTLCEERWHLQFGFQTRYVMCLKVRWLIASFVKRIYGTLCISSLMISQKKLTIPTQPIRLQLVIPTN